VNAHCMPNLNMNENGYLSSSAFHNSKKCVKMQPSQKLVIQAKQMNQNQLNKLTTDDA